MWDAQIRYEHVTTTNQWNGLKGIHAMAWNPALLFERKLVPTVSARLELARLFRAVVVYLPLCLQAKSV